MILGAIEKGLEMICFTDHFDKDNMDWGEEDIFDPEEYFSVLTPLQEKYRDQIDVRIGVETGIQPHLGAFYEEFERKYPFDLIIGSVHSIRRSDIALGKLYEDYTDEEIQRITFEETLESVRRQKLNMAGLKYGLPFAHPHPDVLRRYKELGGEIITVGSDAHQPSHLAYDFGQAEDILKSCGFTYYTEFRQRKPVFKRLA